MRRETQNILLVLLGGALLKLALTDTYLRYVKESLRPWLIATGAIMVVLALVAIVRDIRREREHDHDHRSHSTWLLLLPVLAVFLISPPALGADTVTGKGNTAPKAGAGFEALPDETVVPLTITDFVMRTAWDDSGSLDDRTVRLTGFVARQGTNVYIARLTISCCAADARPVKALLAGQDFATLPTDQWIEATGRVVPGSATQASAFVPTLTVTTITTIPAPPEPYED
ncbi:TIGR03943 family protein [Saccharothrix violaceirubra]|uniref:Putative repeat protein (TIGR03943 family) n=1 Tax=Saccharothrix violaceirubra TaxID=413306 RepID=A0A7W7WXW3_9PSEU|nr:TIGR03943 family protein [Saccharothrix violaceirubra]MBB4967864.1 putative repeat protein (TIGR03943 family) [Saccharothrix violaceirubra]